MLTSTNNKAVKFRRWYSITAITEDNSVRCSLRIWEGPKGKSALLTVRLDENDGVDAAEPAKLSQKIGLGGNTEHIEVFLYDAHACPYPVRSALARLEILATLVEGPHE